MKRTVLFIIIFLLGFAASFPYKLVAQETNDELTVMKQAKDWFDRGEWAKGLNLKAHESVDIQEFANQYQNNTTLWTKAFEYLKNTNLDSISPGKHVIDGNNVYAIVSVGQSKGFEYTKWEGHRNYIDIQYVIHGSERMGIVPLSKAMVTDEYNETNDVTFYSVPDIDSKYYIAKPGTFLIFFPKDVHRPGITTGTCDTVKKIVIKIRAAK